MSTAPVGTGWRGRDDRKGHADTMYAPVDQKAFTFAARCEEAFLIAKFDGVETSVSIHAADQEQVVTLLNRLVARIEQGALPG